MSANADLEDLAYVSEIPFGIFAAAAAAPIILWMVLSHASPDAPPEQVTPRSLIDDSSPGSPPIDL